MSKLTSVANELRVVMDRQKAVKKHYENIRERFFEETEKTVDPDSLARKSVLIDIKDLDEAKERAIKYNPGWLIEDQQELATSGWTFIMVQDPKFVPVSFVDDDIYYSKIVSSGQLQLDDERLQEENPELWKKITEEKRVLLDWDTIQKRLTQADTANLQNYVYEKSKTLKVGTPRKAKPEDYDE